MNERFFRLWQWGTAIMLCLLSLYAAASCLVLWQDGFTAAGAALAVRRGLWFLLPALLFVIIGIACAPREKKEIARGRRPDAVKEPPVRHTRTVQAVLLCASLLLLLLGVFNGGVTDVLGKAVRICTECIGLG